MFSQPDLWRLQWGGLWQHWSPAPIFGGPAAVLESAKRRYTEWFWGAKYHRYLFELPFLIAALGNAFRRQTFERSLALVVLVFHLFLAMLASSPHAGYMFAVYPLLCVLMASMWWGSPGRIGRWCGAVLIAFYLLQSVYWIRSPDKPLPRQATADVLRHVGEKPFLVADNLWFYFPGQLNLRTIVAVNFMSMYAPGAPWADAFQTYLRQEQIDFVAVDKVMQEFLTPAQRVFLEDHTVLVRRYDYGPGRWIKIRRLARP